MASVVHNQVYDLDEVAAHIVVGRLGFIGGIVGLMGEFGPDVLGHAVAHACEVHPVTVHSPIRVVTVRNVQSAPC